MSNHNLAAGGKQHFGPITKKAVLRAKEVIEKTTVEYWSAGLLGY